MTTSWTLFMKHICTVWGRQQWKSLCERSSLKSISTASWTPGRRFWNVQVWLCLKKWMGLGILHTLRFSLMASTCCAEIQVSRNGLCLWGEELRNQSQNILNYFSYPGPCLELFSRHKDSVLRMQFGFSLAAWFLIAAGSVPAFPWAARAAVPERARPCPHGGNVGLFLGTSKSARNRGKVPFRDDWSSYLAVCKAI